MKAGWSFTTLGAVAQVGAGNSAPQGDAFFANGTHPFFRTSDAGRVRFGDIKESSDYLNDVGIKRLRRFPAGTILFPKSGASTFLNHRVMLGVDGYVSSHLATIVGDEAKVNRRFILYFLSTIFSQDLIQDHAYPSLNLPMIAGIPVMLPPLLEQQLIVTLLDESFEGIATAKAHTVKNLQNARAIFESHLQSVFTQRGEGWLERSLDDAFKTATGTTPPKNNSDFYGDFMPLAKPPELCNSPFDTAPDGLSEAGAEVARTLPPNSILVSCIGNLGKIGMNTVPVAFNQQINAILPDEKQAIPEFMFFQALSLNFKEQLESLASGTTVPIVNKSKFNSVRIVLPSLVDQKISVGQLDALRYETRRLESTYQKKLTALDELKESLLHRAFTAQL